MARRELADCADAFRWLRANGHGLAPLTGQDWSALESIAHCWRLYSRSDAAGQAAAIAAVRELVRAMQPHVRALARELIAWAMNWEDRGRLWPLVVGAALAPLAESPPTVRAAPGEAERA